MRYQTRKYAAFALLLAAMASGCAGGGGPYPSLAIRPIETASVTEAPAAPQVIRPLTNPARIAELQGAAAASHAAFVAQEGRAQSLARAAAGQSFESSARAAALVAMADLDSRRAATATTLAALDGLAAEAAAALSADPALIAAQTEIAALLAEEDETIARLWEVMGS